MAEAPVASAGRNAVVRTRDMKFIAVQTGARRGYAVPAILHEAGMLEQFYTDVCGSVGVGVAAGALRHLPVVGQSFERLHARRLPQQLVAKTRTFAAPAIRRTIDAWRTNGDAASAFRRSQDFADRWGAAMVRAGFGEDAALELAADGRIDLHDVLTLVDRGCPPHLAARIVAPL